MKKVYSVIVCLFLFCLYACSLGDKKNSYNNPEEELCAIMENQGWEQISNCTNVYRKDIDEYVDGEYTYKTTYWYTAAIYSKKTGNNTKFVIARPVYESGENEVAYRHEDGKLKYKTFSIVGCDYTDKYGRTYNGYISDGGFIAYLNY